MYSKPPCGPALPSDRVTPSRGRYSVPVHTSTSNPLRTTPLEPLVPLELPVPLEPLDEPLLPLLDPLLPPGTPTVPPHPTMAALASAGRSTLRR